MALPIEVPEPPTLEHGADVPDADGDTDEYRRAEIETYLQEGAWTTAMEEWGASTELADGSIEIAADLGMFAEFDFFWDPFALRIGYHAPGIPEDWQERNYHDRLDSWKTVSAINAAMATLGSIAAELMEEEYAEWETEPETPDDLPDFE
jgi:hypothetical protein